MFKIILYVMNMAENKKILLHCCCGPCSTSSLLTLINEGLTPVLYFSNSNIDTQDESDLRYENLLIVAKHHNLEVVRDKYDHVKWLEYIKGYEEEKEHGLRCSLCFYYNLREASAKAKELNIEYFTTTLTVSRFKNSLKVFAEGNKFDNFQEFNFKKKNGFALSVQYAKELNLYRQDFCGCEFSKRREH